MSVKLARKVIDSGLSWRLKHTATVLAFCFADDNGDRIYPSVAHLAHKIGKDVRRVRADLTALIKLGVLVPVTPRTGGKRRPTHYRLDATALPIADAWASKGGQNGQGIDTPNPDESARVSDANPGRFEHQTRTVSTDTRTFSTPNPDESARQLERDQKEDQKEDQSAPSARVLSLTDKKKTAETEDVALARHIKAVAASVLVNGNGTFATIDDFEAAVRVEVGAVPDAAIFDRMITLVWCTRAIGRDFWRRQQASR